MNVAILYICTGKYEKFWQSFYKSCKEFLLPDCNVNYYVFTDVHELYGERQDASIHRYGWAWRPWPTGTIFRYHKFLDIQEEILENDFVFFFNANSIILSPVNRKDILPPEGRNFVALNHYQMYNKPRSEFPYERRPRSMAYIAPDEGEYYFHAAMIGGRSDMFIEMCRELARNVDKDLRNNIIATFHDESYWNRFLLGRDDVYIIQPNRIGDESANPSKIAFRYKTRYMPILAFRGHDLNTRQLHPY